MATMNISLPEQMKAWVEKQSESGQYSNSSDFVRDLIRREQIKSEKIAYVKHQVVEGIKSGVGTMTKAELLKSARAQTKARLGNRVAAE
jgi:antitoxin ParD1/3/4